MTSIIEAIDDYTADFFSDYNLKNWGFCELMKKTAGEGSAEQPIPVTIPERKPVAIKDNYEVITWIRQPSIVTYEDNQDWSFGKNEARMSNMPLRIVFANKTNLTDAEDLVYQYVNSFPSRFSIPNYKFVFVTGTPTVDPDHESIYAQELGNTAYEKHRFPWNLYVVNLTVQFIYCESDYRLTESGDYRILE